jgi:hypothetical protein
MESLAIGADARLGVEAPVTAKKSFMQKFNETHEALKLQIRSIQSSNLDRDERPDSPRTSSSSSANKDLLKLSPVNWTKSDRTRNDFAVRYDDVANDNQPLPMTVQTLPEVQCGPRLPQAQGWARGFTLSEAAPSKCQFGSRGFAFGRRTRSLPNTMSEEEMDAWLDHPEDAEVHRHRKLSAVKFARGQGSTLRAPSFDDQEKGKRNHSMARRQFASPRTSSDQQIAGPKITGKPDTPLPTAETRAVLPQELGTTLRKSPIHFSSFPDELLLEIARYLDMKSVAQFKASSRKTYDTVPAPLKPLAVKKT